MSDREKLQAEALLGAVEDGDVVWSGSPRLMRRPISETPVSPDTPLTDSALTSGHAEDHRSATHEGSGPVRGRDTSR